MKKKLLQSLLSLLFLTLNGYSQGCCCYDNESECSPGPRGKTGPQGPPGKPGTPAKALDFADFYALMPSDNNEMIRPGNAINFPQDGPSSPTGFIHRQDIDSFCLVEIGTYLILFQVGVEKAILDKSGQLVLTLDSGNGAVELLYTVTGKVTGSSQIGGTVLVQTTSPNSILSVRNPKNSHTWLKIISSEKENLPVSAHLIITRLL